MSIVHEFTSDYTTQFIEYTDLLFYLLERSSTTVAERKVKVTVMVNAYVEKTGRRPDYRQLDRLSTLILSDDLRDTDSHKVTRNEYPILSDSQLDRRKFGGRGQDSNMHGETSLEAAEHVAIDGRDYRVPNRRIRTIDELISVDEVALLRNRDINERYRRDTSPGIVKTYNLRENGGKLTESFTQCVGLGERWLDEMSAVNEITVESPEEYVREAA